MITKPGLNQNNNKSSFITESTEFFSARVKRIILEDKTYPEIFKEYGEWGSVGVIFFEDTKNPDPNINRENYAYPLFPYYKHFPLENEIVFVIKLSSYDIQGNPSSIVNYYVTPINIWNNTNHNAVPDNIYSNSDKLGNYFSERKIRSLFNFEGDVIIEGRWGNSIRFGSTTKNNLNQWSEVGTNGDPIIIIRNGDYVENKDSWIPTIEDINKDKSEIILTSTQKIPIEVSSNKYKSYNQYPTSPNNFKDSQIILSSNRILLNSKKDHILLNSKKSIGLSSIESINIDTKELSVDASKILLGNRQATEPILLGNKTVELLQKVFIALQELCTVLPTVGTPSPGTPNVAVAQSATKLGAILQQILPLLPTIKSKQNYTV